MSLSPQAKGRVRVLAGLAVSGACLAYVLRQVDWGQLWSLARHLDPLFILWVNLLYALSFAVRTLRWQVLLGPVTRAGFAPLMSANLIGFMANNLLPARLGELVRAVAAARLVPAPLAGTLATLLVERMLDGPVVLAFLFVVLLFLDPAAQAGAFDLGVLRAAGMSLAGVWVALLVLLAAVVRWPQRVAGGAGWLLAKVNARLGVRLRQLLLTFALGLTPLSRPRTLAALLLLSVGVRAPIYAMHTVFLLAVGLPLSPLLGAMAALAALLATSVPAAPGAIGAFQLATYWALVMAGAPEQPALAYSILYWAAQYFPLVAAGLIELNRRGLTLGGLNRRSVKGAAAPRRPAANPATGGNLS